MPEQVINEQEVKIVKGQFVADFVTDKPIQEGDILSADFSFLGRTRLFKSEIIPAVPTDISEDRILKKDSIFSLEVYPIKGQPFPLESEKRLYVKVFRLVDPVIEDSFVDKGRTKGRISGTGYALLSKKEFTQEELSEIKKSYFPIDYLENLNKEQNETITTSAVKEEQGCGRNLFTSTLQNNGGSGCLNRFRRSPLAGMLGRNAGNGCRNSGCQRAGCGLLSLLALLALLLSLLRQCDGVKDWQSGGKTKIIRDTVWLVETDTIEYEKIVVDTFLAVDTLVIKDTETQLVLDVLPVAPVLFKTNSAIIRLESVNKIKDIGDFMIKHDSIELIVSGHTDSDGEEDHNDILSFCRAKAVVDVLIDRSGVEASRLTYNGYGERCPNEGNNSREGKTINRRVEYRYPEQPVLCAEPAFTTDPSICDTKKYRSGVEIKKAVLKEVTSGEELEDQRQINNHFLFSEPDSTSNTIYQITTSDILSITEINDPWYQIHINDKEGYMRRSTVQIIKD